MINFRYHNDTLTVAWDRYVPQLIMEIFAVREHNLIPEAFLRVGEEILDRHYNKQPQRPEQIKFLFLVGMAVAREQIEIEWGKREDVLLALFDFQHVPSELELQAAFRHCPHFQELIAQCCAVHV